MSSAILRIGQKKQYQQSYQPRSCDHPGVRIGDGVNLRSPCILIAVDEVNVDISGIKLHMH